MGEYEGDHLAVYVTDFLEMYRRARAVRGEVREVSIVWNNPCFRWAREGWMLGGVDAAPRDCYDTEELVLQQNQFRFKDFIDQETGEVSGAAL